MRYCLRCCFPENSKPYIIFDEQGICSGCRTFEQRQKINWSEKQKEFKEILDAYKEKTKKNGALFAQTSHLVGHESWECTIQDI